MKRYCKILKIKQAFYLKDWYKISVQNILALFLAFCNFYFVGIHCTPFCENKYNPFK